jgi:nitrite reductase (NO-forming)
VTTSTESEHTQPPESGVKARIEWLLMVSGLSAMIAVAAIAIAVVAFASPSPDEPASAQSAPVAHAVTNAPAKAPTVDEARGVEFERFQRVSPDLPEVPAGAVKEFTVDVRHHVVQVAPDLAPTEVWTYAVNGLDHRGTGASAPMVVNEGDDVKITFVNGSTKAMKVNMPHSVDYHSAEVDPSSYYVDVPARGRKTITFVAEHPGVFMYHCATQPILLHTGAGMMGMMIVKPKDLAPVDRELWITQQEFYLGKPGGLPDMDKLSAGTPDVLAFNGYAAQYKTHPILVERGERIRMYVLDAGPSRWSAFHVIGTVFDRTVVEGVVGEHAQTINLAPSQGGWVEFTLDQEGSYPFLTHSFADMTKGAIGVLRTKGAPEGSGHGH